MKHRLLHQHHTALFIFHAATSGWNEEYQPEKHQISYTLTGGERLFLRLPLQVGYPFNEPSQENTFFNYIQLLVESGVASVGYFENGENVDHKVFRAYMVRKKQGMSQLKYLKTKGKSRAGSRVRLAETEEFFAAIQERINRYLTTYRVDRIAISCSLTLWPYLFGQKAKSPFSKDDNRVYKIPMHVPNCTYENLMNVHDFLSKGELKYELSLESQISGILSRFVNNEDSKETESW